MIVGEPVYLLSLIPVALVFYLLPAGSVRVLFLLAVSYAFYSTYQASILIILAGVSLAAYVGAIVTDRIVVPRARLAALVGAIVVCMMPLVIYKYLLPALSAAPHITGADWDFSLAQSVIPVGLSFYTFIAVGYLIDVHLGILAPERNPGRFGLYMSFFPQLTAGPIARATGLLPQLDLNRPFRAEMAMRGVQEILIGTVMKICIADSLSAPVNAIYADPLAMPAAQVLLATFLFAFQLYADFAGYSLIAIGSARLLGVELAPNFRQPYLSAGIQEFWRSWHMSLFTWLRDYVFTPLRMHWRKAPQLGMNAAMLITLTLVGVWHGVGWGFIMFGAVHGILMIVSTATLTWRNALWARLGVPARLVHLIRVPVTFGVVMLTMVLLRARDLGEALAIYRGLFSAKLFGKMAMGLPQVPGVAAAASEAMLDSRARMFYLGLVLILVLGDLAARFGVKVAQLPAAVRATLYTSCALAVLYQAVMSNGSRPFIYLQF